MIERNYLSKVKSCPSLLNVLMKQVKKKHSMTLETKESEVSQGCLPSFRCFLFYSAPEVNLFAPFSLMALRKIMTHTDYSQLFTTCNDLLASFVTSQVSYFWYNLQQIRSKACTPALRKTVFEQEKIPSIEVF